MQKCNAIHDVLYGRYDHARLYTFNVDYNNIGRLKTKFYYYYHDINKINDGQIKIITIFDAFYLAITHFNKMRFNNYKKKKNVKYDFLKLNFDFKLFKGNLCNKITHSFIVINVYYNMQRFLLSLLHYCDYYTSYHEYINLYHDGNFDRNRKQTEKRPIHFFNTYEFICMYLT